MNKMKKFLAAFIAIGTLLTMAGCGADETADSTVSTIKRESLADKETAEQTELVVEEKTEVTAMELADDAVLEIDMGNVTSKEIGDLMSKTLIERGKEMASKLYPNVEYGDLPAKTLTELGKQAISDNK